MAVINHVKPLQTTDDADPVITNLVAGDHIPWYQKRNLRTLYILLFPTCMGIELTSGFDSQLINALQIVPSWVEYFHNPQGSLKGIISAAYSLGAILSLPFIPMVNEKFGRRGSIFGGSCIMILGAIVQGLSQNVIMYIFARLILGFGIPTCIVSGSSLIGELGYPKERPVLTSLFNVAYFFGQIAAAGITFGTNSIPNDWAWRIPSFLQMAPSLLQITFIYMIPESPRWLISHDRIEEAEGILVKYHAEGDAESEFVKAEMAQIRATLQLETEAARHSWMDLVSTAGMRRRLLITSFLGLFTQWSGNTLISYYFGDLLGMIGITSSITKQKLNVANACWALVNAFVISMFVTKFKRRTLYLTCTISLLCCYTAWTISMEKAQTAKEAGGHNNEASIANVVFLFLYSACYNIGYNALTYTYMVELWPYMERSRGIAIYQLFSRLAGFFTTFVNPIGLNEIKWKWLIVYCCWLVFEINFVYFLFPETANRTLEELAFLFEDKDLAERATGAVEKVVQRENNNTDLEQGDRRV
ncbi:general substrate transporter [Corynespora cassiicola Philippines]|uniref:General substrate transporter n=1 Tax=Corynespora cassiicola Philippines TaxID=1448308 RepID=A0A2T2NB10_CORCC|nr:general substrate transporter [Corynespora cassiicola Philippines]